MSRPPRRARLRAGFEEEFEIFSVKVIVEKNAPDRESDEQIVWIEEESSPIPIFRMKTITLLAFATLFVTGATILA